MELLYLGLHVQYVVSGYNAVCIDLALSLPSPSPASAVDDPKDIAARKEIVRNKIRAIGKMTHVCTHKEEHNTTSLRQFTDAFNEVLL